MTRPSDLLRLSVVIPDGQRARFDEHAAAIAAALGIEPPAALDRDFVDRLRRALIEASSSLRREWRMVTLAEVIPLGEALPGSTGESIGAAPDVLVDRALPIAAEAPCA
jgi:hypothetical protein